MSLPGSARGAVYGGHAQSLGGNAPTTGSVRVDGRPIDHPPASRREIGIVVQNYALFPTGARSRCRASSSSPPRRSSWSWNRVVGGTRRIS